MCLYIALYIVLYIALYIIENNNGIWRKIRKTPQALILRGLSVEVAGFEPAAFWSRTIRQCSIFKPYKHSCTL